MGAPQGPAGGGTDPASDRRPGSGAADVLGAVAAAAAAIALMVLAEEPDARPADAAGALLLALAAVPLIGRRRWPVPALLAVLALSMLYLSSHYPGGAELPLVMTGLYSVAATGNRLGAVLVGTGWLAFGSAYRVLIEGHSAVPVLTPAVLLALVGVLGDLVATRRRLRWEHLERLRAVTAERELAAQRQLTDERLRIAHELHDVMAHTLTTMSVQAGAAADLLPGRPGEARAILGQVRQSSREAMRELRATIALLRGDGGETPRQPAPGLGEVAALVQRVEAAGLQVDVARLPDGRRLPDAVELTAYRVIQEALTNVLRHAAVDRASVHVEETADALRIRVEDDGAGSDGAAVGGGHGLAGLQERVTAMGGQLQAGPREGGGFSVQAVLPLEGRG